MPEATDSGFVQPSKGDPFVGHLSTPISDSDFTKAFIGNLPIYRPGPVSYTHLTLPTSYAV